MNVVSDSSTEMECHKSMTKEWNKIHVGTRANKENFHSTGKVMLGYAAEGCCAWPLKGKAVRSQHLFSKSSKNKSQQKRDSKKNAGHGLTTQCLIFADWINSNNAGDTTFMCLLVWLLVGLVFIILGHHLWKLIKMSMVSTSCFCSLISKSKARAVPSSGEPIHWIDISFEKQEY